LLSLEGLLDDSLSLVSEDQGIGVMIAGAGDACSDALPTGASFLVTLCLSQCCRLDFDAATIILL
jgi:hypothetical protein